MEVFFNDINAIYDALNNNKDSNNKKHIIKTFVLSKQYLTYYLYRILTKFINLILLSIPAKQIRKLLSLLQIPKEHDYTKNYPLVGRMTNDEKLLNLIILTILDIFTNVDIYTNTLPNKDSYNNFYKFLKSKSIAIILQDLQDLYTLIPNITIKASRFKYNNDNKI